MVFLTDAHLPDDAEFRIFPPHAIVGSTGARIIPELAATPEDVVIPKRRYSGLFGTDLDITLRERAVDTVRLVGDCTNVCVLYTAADARNLGYTVEVVEDAVTSFDEKAHLDALRELEKTLGAKVLGRPRALPDRLDRGQDRETLGLRNCISDPRGIRYRRGPSCTANSFR